MAGRMTYKDIAFIQYPHIYKIIINQEMFTTVTYSKQACDEYYVKLFLLYLLYWGRFSYRWETISQTMDIECVSHQTNAPTIVETSQKHKVHMTLSLHKSSIHAKNSSNVQLWHFF
jgi:hypothetical protein